MPTIRKRGSRFNVQIRKEGYPFITKTFTGISVTGKWAPGVESNMERRLHVTAPNQATVTELLKRYETQIFPNRKGQ
ncbi:MAG: hypothetical protein ACJ0US_11155 [Arenicellales bacterium]